MGYTHGTKWNDELIESTLMSVIEELNIDHFPSHAEIESITGNKALSCAISKKQGSVFWSEKIGYPIKYSETSFGNKYEVFAINDIFENTMLCSVQTSSRHPYDILTNNSVKIDVKASKQFTNNCGSSAYTFNLEKREPTCDIFILYCVSDDGIIQKKLVVPSCALLGQTQLGVGVVSKWDFYESNWSCIMEYSSFHEKFKTERIKI